MKRISLILASRSPRRSELLRGLGLSFKIVPSDIDEHLPKRGSRAISKAVVALAVEKAKAVAKRYPNAAVLGADTVVVLGNEILGKPADPKEAERMLARLSGSTHWVITGIALVYQQKVKTDFEKTKVVFRKLTPRFIREYVRTGSPLDKAGGYGIQEQADACVQQIKGDYFNVMGLPLAKVKKLLAGEGIDV